VHQVGQCLVVGGLLAHVDSFVGCTTVLVTLGGAGRWVKPQRWAQGQRGPVGTRGRLKVNATTPANDAYHAASAVAMPM
jgi:sugar/nucleoside kinase (ribokinase family)